MKNLITLGEKALDRRSLSPEIISFGKTLFPVDLDILLPLSVSILACIQ